MSQLKFLFTDQGLAALIAADSGGFKANIHQIGFGDSAYTPTKNQTGLRNERERVEINDYQQEGQTLRLAAVFDGDQDYDIKEVGLFLEDGTLLGVYSTPDRSLGYKTAAMKVVQWVSIPITALPVGSFSVQVNTHLDLIFDRELITDAAAFLRQGAVSITQAHWQLTLSEQLRNRGGL